MLLYLQQSLQGLFPTKHHIGTVEGKRIVIVDDVTTSGDTITDVIKVVKDHGGNPIVVTVLIDKSGLEEVDGVPIESLIKVSQLR